jgi:outer membrane receptor for ferrienterochelin and colicins
VDIEYLPPLPRAEIEEQAGQVGMTAALETEEDVVVGAAKREQSLGSVASAVTVISGDRLRRFGYRTIAEALDGVAGMFIVNDRWSPRLGVRGLQILADFNTRILVLIDGAAINEPWNQFTGIYYDMPVNMDEIDRVEVIRGPVSSVYGTNAFFGIINIVTRSADRSPGAFGRIDLSTFGANTAAAGFATGDVNRQVRGSIGGTWRFGEEVPIPAAAALGEPTTSGADGMYSLRGSLVATYDGAFLQVRAYRHHREMPAAPYEGVIGDDRNFARDSHVMVEGGYARSFGERVDTSVRAYFNRYRFEDYIVYEPDPNYRDIGDAMWIGTEARGRLALLDRGRLGLTAGTEVAHIETRSLAFEVGDRANGAAVDTPFDTVGLYSELDAAPTSWLSLAAGVRLDVNTIFSENVSPRAALFLHRGQRHGLKLLYAEGFRNPGAYEAFFDDNITFLPDPDIGPESIRAYEAVLWGRPAPGLDLRVSGFVWDFEDLIDTVSIPFDDPEDPEATRLQFQNATSGRVVGAELEGSYRNLAGWYGFAGAALHRVRADEEGGGTSAPPNAPLATASLGASTPLLFDLGHVSTEVVFVSERKTRDESFTADPVVRWNATIHVPDLRGFDLTIGVRNLLGIREEVPLSEDYDRGEDILPWISGESRELYARLGHSF